MHNFSKRTSFGAVAVAATLALTACGGGISDGGGDAGASSGEFTPSTSGEVSLYTWSDYFPEELIGKFKQDTGVTLKVDYYDSNESLEAKLRASDGAGYDVVVPSDYMVQILKDSDLLMKINAADLPNGKNIEASFLDVYFDQGRKYSVPYLYGTTSFAYNSDKIPADQAPTSWADFFNPPASAGGVGVMDDMVEGVNAALRVVGGDLCTTDGPTLQAAQDLLVGFKPSVGTINSDGILERLAGGEQAMAMIWNGAAYRAGVDNPAIKFVYPKEGIALWQDNFAVPSGAKNVNQALTFLNWMMKPENMAVAVNFQAYASGIKGTTELMKPELASSPAITIPDGYDKALPVQPCNNDELSNYSKIWETFKG